MVDYIVNKEVSIVDLKAAGIKALNLKNDSIAAVDVFDPFRKLFSIDS